MRPILLEMENIGPFVKRTSVDFSRFGNDSLFLISGKTGSGKSFIFDSICYALFGETPSRREGNLPSDFKRSEDKPRILFRFSIGEDVYEVERTLPYEEEKKRGSGTTVRGETQTLKRVHPKADVLAKKKNDVKERCEELLQLKMDQFQRVIMIPQGEFRELLKASTEEREKLLRQLFRSYDYLEIARELEIMMKSLYGRYEDLRKSNDTVLDQLMAGLPSEGIPPEGEIGISAIIEHRNKVEGSLPTLKERIGSLSSEYDKAREETIWIESVLNLVMARSELVGQQGSRLETRKERIDPLREKVRRHDLASELGKELGSITDRKSRIGQLEDVRMALLYDLGKRSQVLVDLEKRKDRVPELKRRHEEILSNQGRISELMSDLQREKDLKKVMTTSGKDEKRFTKELSSILSKNDSMNVEQGRLKKEIEDRSKPFVDIEWANSRYVIVKDLIDVLSHRSKEVPALSSVQDRISRTSERSKGLLSTYEELKQRRDGSMAHELASGLVSGHPCPVCGSKRHPTPASAPETYVTKEEVQRAEVAYRTSLADLEELKSSSSSIVERIDGFDRRIRQMTDMFADLASMDIGVLSKERDSLKDRIESEKKRLSDLAIINMDVLTLSGQQNRLNEERSKVLTQLEKARSDKENSTKQLKEVASRIETNRSTLSSLVPGETDIMAIIHRINDEKDRLPQMIQGIERDLKEASDSILQIRSRTDQVNSDIESTRKDLSSMESELEERVKGPRYSLFSSVAELRSAMIDPVLLKDTRSEIDLFDSDLSILKGRIEQTEKDLTDRLKDRTVPTPGDLDRQRTIEGVRKNELDATKELLSSLNHEIRQIDTSLKRIEDVAKAMSEMEPDLAILKDLSDQVKGNGRPKISLERFFLAQRFEEVLIEANTRLRKLSEGRFDLKREDERETGGGAKSGLDIVVCDNLTGTERPANTLSGGQMFLTSLALALGLADVVQARSGGIRMDALFIDEGFGSLDEDTLQIALKVLSELKRDRMVGVISHVQELKRQIPQRIEVIAGREGSTLTIIA